MKAKKRNLLNSGDFFVCKIMEYCSIIYSFDVSGRLNSIKKIKIVTYSSSRYYIILSHIDVA